MNPYIKFLKEIARYPNIARWNITNWEYWEFARCITCKGELVNYNTVGKCIECNNYTVLDMFVFPADPSTI